MLLDNLGSGRNMRTYLGRLLLPSPKGCQFCCTLMSLALSSLPSSFEPSPPPSTHATVCPLPCILKGYLQMVAGRMNLYQRHLGDVAGTRLHENYPSPLYFRSSNEGREIFAIPCEKGKIRILLYLRLLFMAQIGFEGDWSFIFIDT